MSVTVLYRFKVAGYNAGTWTSGTLLDVRELGLELDTGKVKLGDGATTWGSLGYHYFWSKWGRISGTLSDQTDLQTALGLKADTSSLATVATSGSATDLTTGTLANARLPTDIARSKLEATSSTDALIIPANTALRLRRADTLLVDILSTGGSDGARTISLGSGSGDYGSGSMSLYGGNTVALALSTTAANFSRDIQRAGTKVVGTRRTGWTAPTGTATRTGFATSTATTTQVAESLKALIDDLVAHGLIGS